MMFAAYVLALSRKRDVRGHPGLDARGVGLRDREAQEERVALQERGQDGPWLQVLSSLDGARLDDACERSADSGVPQVELGDAQRLLGRVGVGLRAGDARRVLLDLLACDQARVRDNRSLPARELRLRGLVGCYGLVERCLRLIDGDVVAIHLDDDERIALLDRLPLDEGDLVDRARHTRGDLHLLERVDAARGHHVVLDLTDAERRDLDRVLQLGGRLWFLQRRVVGGLRAGERPGEREHGQHDTSLRDSERSSFHLSSVPSGSSPIACRRFRYASAIEYWAPA